MISKDLQEFLDFLKELNASGPGAYPTKIRTKLVELQERVSKPEPAAKAKKESKKADGKRATESGSTDS